MDIKFALVAGTGLYMSFMIFGPFMLLIAAAVWLIYRFGRR